MIPSFKTRPSLSRLIVIELACLLALILTAGYVFTKQHTAHEGLSEAIRLRHRSFQLADQLRQSSDDLTRMVRSYAATGDPKFARFFHLILDIRNGKAPRPKHYDRIFWDFKTAGEALCPSEEGAAISLSTLMANAGFSDEEFGLLAEAQRRSDELVELEDVAMHALEGKFKDSKGGFTITKEPDRGLALQILFGQEYHAAKKGIMKPINDFLIAIDRRTSRALADAQHENFSLDAMITAVVSHSI